MSVVVLPSNRVMFESENHIHMLDIESLRNIEYRDGQLSVMYKEDIDPDTYFVFEASESEWNQLKLHLQFADIA